MTRVRWEQVGEVAASLQGRIGLDVYQAASEVVRIVRRYHTHPSNIKDAQFGSGYCEEQG